MRSICIALWAIVSAGLVYGQTTPTITSVVDPYTGGSKLSPGGQAVITGTNLGLNPQVTVGGVHAFNIVPPQFGPQITIEIPVNAAIGASVPVVVTTGAGASEPFNIALVQYAPVLISTTSGALTSPRHQSGVAVTASTPAAAGETVVLYGIGLGPVTTPVNTGASAPPNDSTTNDPTVSLGTTAVPGATARLANGQLFFGGSYSGPQSGSTQASFGIYLVSFVVPAGTAKGDYQVSLTIGGAASNSVSLSVGPAPTGPVITAVVNAAGKTALCPGDVAILTGLNLGASPAITVGGKAAYAIHPPNNGNQMTIQIPVDAAVGAANVVLTPDSGTASAPFAITLAQYAPVIPINGGTFLPSHQNGAVVTNTNPAVPGERLFITAYGLGPTDPVVPTGTPGPSNPPAFTVTTPTVNLGGGQAVGVNAGLNSSLVGAYFVTFVVPTNFAAGGYPLSISIGGLTSNLSTVQVFIGPTITNVENAASNISAALPNGGIAQGAIFIIFGSNLGPSTLSIAPAAFQSTSLSGTSISVTVGGTTVAPLLYYTSATQAAALLPSNTPAGKGTITVTYNGQVGIAAPITVVQSNLGIFTVTSDGQGVGIVTNADYSLVSTTKAANCGGPNTVCGAANPGDTLIVWATGLGPVDGRDADGAGLGVSMANIPLTLWLGGVQATVTYQGRSGCCIGEDQIVFQVPDNVPTGCAVPLAIQIGDEISNYTAIAVAKTGTRTCSATNPALTSDFVQLVTTNTGSTSFADLQLKRQPNFDPQGNLTGYSDTGTMESGAFTVPTALQPFMVSYLDVPPPGTCAVYNTLNGATGDKYLTNLKELDAGSAVTLTGPNGSQTIAVNGNRANLGPGNFLAPGDYTVSGTGGADIGSFNAPFTIPTFATLVTPASGTNVAVTRANGFTLTWSGGTSDSFIQIDGQSATDPSNTNGASFSCIVLASAGTFTIPPSVLLALPAGSIGGWDFKPVMFPATFSASGLNLSLIEVNYDTPILTTLQ